MNKIGLISVLLLTVITLNAQELYTKTFGDAKDEALIFLHGGPGYNAAGFEATTAQKLSERGFYVIVYDRRGEGRSTDKNAKFTFQETDDDLNLIYEKLNLKKATLIGHSFGGIVATLFAEKYPAKVTAVVLVGAPVSLQETFKTILTTSKEIYVSKKDSVNLNYIQLLENMDTTSIAYSSYCFMHAMQNGFYYPKGATAEAKEIYATFGTDTLLMKYSSQMTYQAPQGFWKNEQYTTIDLTQNLDKVLKSEINIYALYGKDDGLYSPAQVIAVGSMIGENNLQYLDNCSHNVFIDQQTKFINALTQWLKK